jgi:hypothetical protein
VLSFPFADASLLVGFVGGGPNEGVGTGALFCTPPFGAIDELPFIPLPVPVPVDGVTALLPEAPPVALAPEAAKAGAESMDTNRPADKIVYFSMIFLPLEFVVQPEADQVVFRTAAYRCCAHFSVILRDADRSFYL